VIPVAAMQVTDQGLSWPASPGRAAPGRRPWLHSRRAGDLAHHKRGTPPTMYVTLSHHQVGTW